MFAETDKILIHANGRAGVIVPTGIATDARTQFFFKDLVEHGSIAALYDFENAAPLFPAVHRSFKFSILSLSGSVQRERAAKFAFFVHDPAELDDAGKTFTLTPEEITLLNPNTGTCPVFRSRRDAELALRIYRRIPVLDKEGSSQGNPWNLSFSQGLFNMSHESNLLHDRKDLENEGWKLQGNVFRNGVAQMLPLYEAKMIHHYDHRWATYSETGSTRDFTFAEKRDPDALSMPRYWVPESKTLEKLAPRHWKRGWLLGWRDICRSTDERTAIVAAFPLAAVGHTLPISTFETHKVQHSAFLIATASSFVFDYCARLKIGGTHLNFFVSRQLPVPTLASADIHGRFIERRVLELTYTTNSMVALARDLGDSGPPFVWGEERRALIRAELDALFFHLYGISREDVDYIMETFPIVKRKDEAKYGTYRTKELVLAEYDRMAAAGVDLDKPLVDGENYTSTLTPPPGHGPRHV